MDDEDRLLKGYRLSLELKYEEAYGSFRVARVLAHIDGDEEKELKALRGMADCAFWIGAVDSCIYRYNEALELARKQNEQIEEYDIYTKLRQAYMAKVDMEEVLLISQKIDSLMSVTDNKRITESEVGRALSFSQRELSGFSFSTRTVVCEIFCLRLSPGLLLQSARLRQGKEIQQAVY